MLDELYSELNFRNIINLTMHTKLLKKKKKIIKNTDIIIILKIFINILKYANIS